MVARVTLAEIDTLRLSVDAATDPFRASVIPALGLAVAYNVIADTRRQPSWHDLGFNVPWLTLAVIFAVVYGVAMATTLGPARRASRVYPAEALRYQ